MSNVSWEQVALGCVLVSAFIAGCPSSNQSGPKGEQSERAENDQAQNRLAGEKGMREAKAAITDGRLKLKEYPPTPYPPGHGEYTALLRDKCGVEYEVMRDPDPGPGHSERLQQEVEAWNKMMEAEIRREFGQDIFERLHEEAKKRWQDKLSSPKEDQPIQ
jgi:hypothetical protein